MTVKRLFRWMQWLLCALAVLGVLETLIVRGFLFSGPDIMRQGVRYGFYGVIVLYVLWTAGRVVFGNWNLRLYLHDIALSILLISTIVPVNVAGSIVSLRMLVWMILQFFRQSGITTLLSQVRLNPARVLLGSFLGVITMGTVLLMLPASTADHRGATLVDALFTATSATCVTGLIVQDTGSFFSGFGQTVIAVLIQIGGLGFMTLSTLFAMILGRRLGFRQEEQMRDILDQTSSLEMYRLIIRIITITIVFEGVGAALLYLDWMSLMGSEAALKHAVFHSVSAFCNAGFSLDPLSLSAYVSDVYTNSIFVVLIIFGGLGFVVINDLIGHMKHYNPFSLNWRRLSVHSKLVIISTVSLLTVGTLAIFFFEFDNTMLGLSTTEKLIAAAFQSVTLRTAGFNTIDIAGLREVTLFIAMLLMFIGASPASTGGGIKTTTFAVLLLSIRCLLRSRDEVEVFGRTIRHQTIFKAIAITMFSFTFLVVFTILLLSSQEGRFIDMAFEAVSALGTVGLSTGVTGTLDTFGKLLITALMYVGRVGPLTVALALGEVKKVNVEYPTARITVG